MEGISDANEFLEQASLPFSLSFVFPRKWKVRARIYVQLFTSTRTFRRNKSGFTHSYTLGYFLKIATSFAAGSGMFFSSGVMAQLKGSLQNHHIASALDCALLLHWFYNSFTHRATVQ